MNQIEQNIQPYSKAIVKLLKGVIERDSTVWQDMINYQNDIQEYLSQIGLELIIKKDDGFAFVKQWEDCDGKTIGLASRRQIGFETTIVLLVLRQSLEEFDSNPIQLGSEKYITETEIKEELELFLQEGYNKLKFQKDLNSYIKKAVELGFLKEVSIKDNETKYQIHRIIKEKITLDLIQDFQIKLHSYVESL